MLNAFHAATLQWHAAFLPARAIGIFHRTWPQSMHHCNVATFLFVRWEFVPIRSDLGVPFAVPSGIAIKVRKCCKVARCAFCTGSTIHSCNGTAQFCQQMPLAHANAQCFNHCTVAMLQIVCPSRGHFPSFDLIGVRSQWQGLLF